jgi:serine/threonine protein kinase
VPTTNEHTTATRNLGGCRLESVLHSRNSTTVYRAVSPRGEAVAIKTVHDVSDKVSVLRLYQQAHRSLLFSHPGILSAQRAGEEDGRHFLVMPLLSEGSLAQRLAARGKLSASVAVPLVCRLARALDVMHAGGLVHGNLHPEHVMFSNYGLPVLGGLGYSADRRVSEGLLHVYDPDWSAPELEKSPTPFDPRSDVYGLARLLAAMLTGDGADPMGRSEDAGGADSGTELTRERLCARSIDCDPPLAEVVAQALSQTMDARPASVYAFSESASRAIGGAPESERWLPLADEQTATVGIGETLFVLMRSRKQDCHRMCRGSRREIIRLLLRGRLEGNELAAPNLGSPFICLSTVSEFAAAAKFCGASAR